MCGIVGLLANHPVNQDLYDALTIIQHRGQDAAGIMTSDSKRVFLRKGNGLVRDAIREPHMRRLLGNMGIGHVRYPTAGSESPNESQPFYVNSPYGLALVHNGNLTNTDQLRDDLIQSDQRHLNTASDSEVLLNVMAHALQQVIQSEKISARLTPEILFQTMQSVYARVEGAYSAIMLIQGYGILGFRDPNGIRPLVYGKRKTPLGTEYLFASESVALDALGYTLLGDVAPGEAVYVDEQGVVHRQQCVRDTVLRPCIFEYIYLARPDSIINGISVHQARLGMGESLAKKILQEYPDHDIDVVIPVPDTSRTAGVILASELGLPYAEGFVKNRYIGRTFIMPEQKKRRSSVRMKLNAIKQEFSGKNVLLVDDSIVRGTTSKEIIQMARDAGAKKVYFASAAPEVRYPNVYGIDMPNAKELVAHSHSKEEVAALIGADWLVYQDLPSVCEAINAAAPAGISINKFEDSIFTGNYVAGQIDDSYLKKLAASRSDAVKQASRHAVVDEPLDDVAEGTH